jgi:hypothetical protein
MLQVSCPNCRRLLQAVETAAGLVSQCPACGTVFRPEILQSESGSATAPVTPACDDTAFIDSDLAPEREPVQSETVLQEPPSPQTDSAGLRPGCFCYLGGSALSVMLMVSMDRMLIPAEAICWVLGTGLVAATFAFVLAHLLANAMGTWQRWIFRSVVASGAVVALVRFCVLFFGPIGHYPEELLISFFYIGALVIATYPIIVLGGRIVRALAQLRQGFLKAAGRPSHPTERNVRRPSVYAIAPDEELL